MKDRVIVFKLKHLYRDDPVDRLRGVNIVHALQKKDWNVSLYNNQKNIDIIVYIGDDLYDKVIYKHIDAKYVIQDLQDDPFRNVAGAYMRGKIKTTRFQKVLDLFAKYSFRYVVYQLLLKYLWKKSYKEYIKSVDYVVTSSLGLKESVKKYNSNVVRIPDAVENATSQKRDYKSDKIKICWVGTINNIAYLQIVNKVLVELQKIYDVEIVIISSKEIYNDTKLTNLLTELEFEFSFVTWDVENVNANIQLCDIAIAPLPIGVAKSSNKVLSYMSLGVPTICSGSKDYELLAQEKEDSLIYLEDNLYDAWYDALSSLIISQERREEVGRKSYELSANYTLDNVVKQYEELFKSL